MTDVADGFAWIPAQTAVLGSDAHYPPEEQPAREVSVDGFWMQTHQVTNANFAEFVSATGYVTVAERPLDPADYPGGLRRRICSRGGRWSSTAPPGPSTCAT